MEGEREVSYWIESSRWGRGIASGALEAFVQVEVTRPLFARVAEHNIGSAKGLIRAGFVQVDSETSYADGVGRGRAHLPSRLVTDWVPFGQPRAAPGRTSRTHRSRGSAIHSSHVRSRPT